ncbi:MAG: MerR family transcriptional regulator [Candidatus Latescibacteria bacterium]|nr:MerR family transcriptional regulator [Candidatus Latescibacterota bacterium]NIO56154.1 MerR family transcriptional regulator [Candidatus Latescibacterota bacterium]
MPRHPIGVVSIRTGISKDVLRVWERRYGAVTPARTPTGRRLYSDLDIERLRLLRQAVAGGRRISDVAALELTELQALTGDDRSRAEPEVEFESPQAEGVSRYLQESLEALYRLDNRELENILSKAAISLGSKSMRRDVIGPLLTIVGDRWRDGTVRIMHEHLVSAIIRSILGSATNGVGGSLSGPRLIVTTPSGELHELGAIMAASAAKETGWHVVYLGPNLPAEEIVQAAREFQARAVGLSIVCSTGDRHLAEELRKIRRFLDPNVALLIGGRGARHMDSLFHELGATYVEDLAAFQDALDAITI